MNELDKYDPDLFLELVKINLDAFYNDSRLWPAVEFVVERWDAPRHAIR